MKIIFTLCALLSLTANATDERPPCALEPIHDRNFMELMRLTIERLENTEDEPAEMTEEERARLAEVLFAGEKKKTKKLSKAQKRVIKNALTLREQRNALRNSHRKLLRAEENLNNARNTKHLGKLQNLANDYLDALDRRNDLLEEIKSQRANARR